MKPISSIGLNGSNFGFFDPGHTHTKLLSMVFAKRTLN